MSAQISRGLQESEITSQIFATIVMRHFQGLVGILFTSHQLLDAGETELLGNKWVLGHRSIEGSGGHQGYNHQVRNPILKWIAAFKMLLISLHIEGSDLTLDRRVKHHLTTIHGLH